MKTTKALTTVRHHFAVNNHMADTSVALFCVREGMAVDTVLDQLSTLLCGVSEALESMAMERAESNETSPLWSLYYNMTMAQSLVQALNKGHFQCAEAEPA